MVRAALAGIGVALAAAPLGCFVVWRRMAYLGESTAHSALLGVSLSLMFEFSVFLGAIFVSLLMASLVTLVQGRSLFLDTLLGVAGHMSLATGLVVVSFISGVRIELMAYLIGDILSVSKTDLLLIWIGLVIVLVLLFWRWSALLLCTLNEDLAASSGLNPRRESYALTIGLAVVVAVGIKVVGVLLIISMLIIPAASASSASRRVLYNWGPRERMHSFVDFIESRPNSLSFQTIPNFGVLLKTKEPFRITMQSPNTASSAPVGPTTAPTTIDPIAEMEDKRNRKEQRARQLENLKATRTSKRMNVYLSLGILTLLFGFSFFPVSQGDISSNPHDTLSAEEVTAWMNPLSPQHWTEEVKEERAETKIWDGSDTNAGTFEQDLSLGIWQPFNFGPLNDVQVKVTLKGYRFDGRNTSFRLGLFESPNGCAMLATPTNIMWADESLTSKACKYISFCLRFSRVDR